MAATSTTTTKTAAPKAKTTGAGVKKGGPKSGKKQNARNAMLAMQAYFKENRTKYKDLEFKEQQKKLGEEWKSSAQNPKNKTA